MFAVPAGDEMGIGFTAQQKLEHYLLLGVGSLMLISVGSMLVALIDNNARFLVASALLMPTTAASIGAIIYFDTPYRTATKLQKHLAATTTTPA